MGEVRTAGKHAGLGEAEEEAGGEEAAVVFHKTLADLDGG